ncbi:hypothetical protein KUV59_05045 [Marinobacter daepoensis]|uniref:hypothetical protein n=1 Tax=Marinobacter daepoensis TaxID=262077 RepID=UPI001C94985C|nr:hypothetical protein [Marinobacter daepoensis]MBY6032522.1 hypothetical protein [Marinobacter daepoensis]
MGRVSFLHGAFTIIVSTCLSVSANSSPVIDYVEGEIVPNGKIVVTGSSFSKKDESRPLFYWSANGGLRPNLELGRQSWSGGSFNGKLSTEIVHPSSKASVVWDHGLSSGKALEWVNYGSSRVYVFRKKYADFDTTTDVAIRARFNNLKGNFIVGQVVKGQKSGATGVVHEIDLNSDGISGSIFFGNDGGSINLTKSLDFVFGEEMVTDTATAINSEGSEQYPTGTYRTFNFKTVRFWAETSRNNVYIGPGYNDTHEMKMTAEFTDGSVWPNDWKVVKKMTPRQWQTEEFALDSGSIDSSDGRFIVRTDGIENIDRRFKARTSERPARYNQIAQSQVSNGAQPGSKIYYDMLYVDDSWHRAIVCDAQKYSDCRKIDVLIPVYWEDNRIVARFRESDIFSGQLYLYISDGDNIINELGYPLPLAASPSKVELKVE